MTPERFAKGMTFDEYVKYTGSTENLAREAFGGVYFPDAVASAPGAVGVRVWAIMSGGGGHEGGGRCRRAFMLTILSGMPHLMVFPKRCKSLLLTTFCGCSTMRLRCKNDKHSVRGGL